MTDIHGVIRSLEETRHGIEMLGKQARHAADERLRHRLSDREKRILQYFWNQELQRERRGVPIMAVIFLEQDREAPGAEAEVQKRTIEDLGMLEARRYISHSDGRLDLQADGMKWLLHEHPPVVRWWQKTLERIPSGYQIVASILGLVSSIWAVVEITQWLWPQMRW
jgi:hypothetical protein